MEEVCGKNSMYRAWREKAGQDQGHGEAPRAASVQSPGVGMLGRRHSEPPGRSSAEQWPLLDLVATGQYGKHS